MPATAPQAVAARRTALDWSPQPENTSAEQSQGPATSLTPAAALCEAVNTAMHSQSALATGTAQPPGPAAVAARNVNVEPVEPASPTATPQLQGPAAAAARLQKLSNGVPSTSAVTASPEQNHKNLGDQRHRPEGALTGSQHQAAEADRCLYPMGRSLLLVKRDMPSRPDIVRVSFEMIHMS